MKREGSKVWIEDVPDMPVGFHWDMLLRGIEILLKHRGENITLSELMVYSGDAFNLCYPSYWQEAGYLCVPTNTLANVAKALGYDHRWLISPWSPEMRKMDKDTRLKITTGVLDEIWAEIDAGKPVLVGGSTERGCAYWSVAAGYDRDNLMMSHVGCGKAYRWCGIRGMNLNMSPGDGKTCFWNGRVRGTVTPNFVGGWHNNPAFILGDKGKAPSKKDRLINVLQTAIELFNARPHRVVYWGGIVYYFGQEAYEQWAENMYRLEFPEDKDKPRPREAYGWYDMGIIDVMVDCVVKGRAAAADYLEQSLDVIPKAHDNLKLAAELYREEVEIADHAFAPFMPMFVGSQFDRRYILGHRRKKEDLVIAIDKMLKKETAAVKELEKALQTTSKAG